MVNEEKVTLLMGEIAVSENSGPIYDGDLLCTLLHPEAETKKRPTTSAVAPDGTNINEDRYRMSSSTMAQVPASKVPTTAVPVNPAVSAASSTAHVPMASRTLPTAGDSSKDAGAAAPAPAPSAEATPAPFTKPVKIRYPMMGKGQGVYENKK